MDEHLFNEGRSFKDYARSSDLRKTYESTSISVEDQEFFSSCKMKVVCISEKWCKDCSREVPFLAYLADKAGWDLRIFGMDEFPALMERYTTDGKKKIPVFIFFDEAFREVGRFIEKPPEGKTTLEVLKETLGNFI